MSPPTTKMSNESGAKKQYGPVKNPYANTLRNYFEYLKKESKSLMQRSRKQSLDGFLGNPNFLSISQENVC